MTPDMWIAYRVNLASYPGIMQRPSIRSLFYDGLEVDTIADATNLPIEFVQQAILEHLP